MNERSETAKVLQFIGSFHSGGSERQAVQLSRLLSVDGEFAVKIAALNKEGILLDEIDFIDHADIKEYKISSFFSPGFLLKAFKFRRFLNSENIKLVHTHDFYSNVFASLAIFGSRKTAHIASKRETGGMRTPNQAKLENIVFPLANTITVNAQAVKDFLINNGVASQKIEVIYNGLDMSRFERLATKQDVLTKYNIDILATNSFITIVANLRHDVKNIPMLLRAASLVLKKRNDVTFIIAGEGQLLTDLRSLAAKLDITQNVAFIGRCDDVPMLLTASDICVLTSVAEGFSNSILEYMAAGKPVVVTKVGGAAEAVVDGETGYIVDSDDDAAMAAKMLSLLNDKDRAQKMGDLGRERVKQTFSIKAQIDNVKVIYRSLIK